jgi:hypothetical protein
MRTLSDIGGHQRPAESRMDHAALVQPSADAEKPRWHIAPDEKRASTAVKRRSKSR